MCLGRYQGDSIMCDRVHDEKGSFLYLNPGLDSFFLGREKDLGELGASEYRPIFRRSV
jgi:hypothetical protein